MRSTCPIAVALLLGLLPVVAQEATASLTGKVEDQSGVSIPHALAELRSERFPSRTTRADTSGVYGFANLPSGEYTLHLGSPGFKQLQVNSIRVSEGEQKSLPLVQLEISSGCSHPPFLDHLRLLSSEEAVGNFRGTLLVDRGPVKAKAPPVAGADMTLTCAKDSVCGETKTDSNGEFVFTDLPAGIFKVRVRYPGFYPLDVPNIEVKARFESVYWPLYVERCPKGNCDPRRRPRKPVGYCE
jgi:hypothetical protein